MWLPENINEGSITMDGRTVHISLEFEGVAWEGLKDVGRGEKARFSKRDRAIVDFVVEDENLKKMEETQRSLGRKQSRRESRKAEKNC